MAKGSPPRGRGKALHRHRDDLCAGITPAWAGKSPAHSDSHCPSWDHPRVGGEKFEEMEEKDPHLGSPPRGRGKDEQHLILQRDLGITPAWAGKRRGAY